MQPVQELRQEMTRLLAPNVDGRTLKWLKVKQPHYREGERRWEPKWES